MPDIIPDFPPAHNGNAPPAVEPIPEVDPKCHGERRVEPPPLTLDSPQWDHASSEDRLAVVVALPNPPDWFRRRSLETLVDYRPIEWEWGRIKAEARIHKVVVRALQRAVDRLRAVEQPIPQDAEAPHTPDWMGQLLSSKAGDPQETLGNCKIAL